MRAKGTLESLIAGLLIVASLHFCAPAGHAAGLRTKFGEVVVRGLKIGQTYSLNDMIKLPLKILNTGDKAVQLKSEVVIPKPDAMRAGYEPIPDVNWISLDKTEHLIEPNHESVSDVTIAIPNDPKLLGRRFEAAIWSRTTNKTDMFAVGLQSRLLIHVASEPPTGDELKQKFIKKNLANMDFTLHPAAGSAENVPLGREVDLKKEHKISIKIVNPNEEKLHFRIKAEPNWEALVPIPGGFEDAYVPSWVKAEKEVIEVDGNSIKETRLLLNIPKDDRYYAKNFFFAIAVDILEQEIPARVFYRLAVTTEAKPEGAKKP